MNNGYQITLSPTARFVIMGSVVTLIETLLSRRILQCLEN